MIGSVLLRPALAVLALMLALGTVQAEVRIKDIAHFEGIRENQLIGYGLVVGLNGSGDTLKNSPFTRKSMEGMLGRLGVGNLTDEQIKTRNTAAVMVTGNLPGFSRSGSTIDIVVSSLGDATSLKGGTLLVTPLSGADGNIYAVAQGPVAVSGFSVRGQAASVTEGVPTVARIENGAIVEREIEFSLNAMSSVRLALRNPDFTTASRMADAINETGDGLARMLDPGTVEVSARGKVDIPQLLAAIENLTLLPDSRAKVVIDAKTGTIVMGSNVRIDEVAISQGGLTVMVRESAEVSQPMPLSIGGTVVVPSTDIALRPRDSGFSVLEGQVSLQELVDGLNAIGINTQDTIAILQALKAAGALHADLEII
ncbi:flagellar basal body P-ring protein FlgI [Pseudogemmobacter faecipullorum]|uniref:Flagellar P-ring protein n=1 Tax=Pseudogemmobacter faecipullorum TaxID=2755041 RepID=A0ABS8CNC4_9RHOB|nr:flagellar basal body P-ring protein FlgI [Pseudogemmobacter faecipullorum]MCB5410846.1 flagellar basal body P-ring protein FlgI [Pseudogemmobacter faecipullorum]